jgi:hypothetical protein
MTFKIMCYWTKGAGKVGSIIYPWADPKKNSEMEKN